MTANTIKDYTVQTTFILAGASNACAAVCTNPIDVVKIRMQCDAGSERKYPGLVKGLIKIGRTEGVHVLLTGGLVASLMREFTFSTIRMGGYEPIKRFLCKDQAEPTIVPFYKKVMSGACSGATAALLTTPCDVAKVRLQSEARLTYPHTLATLYRIGRSEGVLKGLWRGTGPNVLRATIGTSTQISSYDQSKNYLLSTGCIREGPGLHFISSFFAGFCTATAYNPIDVVKSRMQSESLVKGQEAKHRNIHQVVMMIVRSEGLFGLYKGWFPCWARISPHTCITFLVFEQLRKRFGVAPI